MKFVSGVVSGAFLAGLALSAPARAATFQPYVPDAVYNAHAEDGVVFGGVTEQVIDVPGTASAGGGTVTIGSADFPFVSASGSNPRLHGLAEGIGSIEYSVLITGDDASLEIPIFADIFLSISGSGSGLGSGYVQSIAGVRSSNAFEQILSEGYYNDNYGYSRSLASTEAFFAHAGDVINVEVFASAYSSIAQEGGYASARAYADPYFYIGQDFLDQHAGYGLLFSQGVGNNPVGAAIPEPAAWALMLVGFGGMGAVLRRRRTAAFRTGC